jgi:hypothetical protein
VGKIETLEEALAPLLAYAEQTGLIDEIGPEDVRLIIFTHFDPVLAEMAHDEVTS